MNCPFCGAKKSSPFTLEYRCQTFGEQHQGWISWDRSDYCRDRQIATLQEQLAVAERLLADTLPSLKFWGIGLKSNWADKIQTFLAGAKGEYVAVRREDLACIDLLYNLTLTEATREKVDRLKAALGEEEKK